MQTFNAFLKIVKNHLPSIILYFVIFSIFSVVLSTFANNDHNESFSADKEQIAVFDYDNSEESKALYKYLDHTHTIINIDDNNEAIADNMYYSFISYALTIKKGFSNDFSKLENVKRPSSTSGEFLDSQINNYLHILESYKAAGYSVSDSIHLTDEAVNTTSDVEFISASSSNEENTKAVTYFFRYLPYTFLATIIINLGTAFCTFRKKDLSARIQCSSSSVTNRNIGIAAAALLSGIAMLILYIALALILYKGELLNMAGLLKCLNSFVFLIFSVGVSYLISFFFNSLETLNMIGNVYALICCFFSGIFVPLEILSTGVKTFAHFLPTYWFTLANNLTDTFTGSAVQFQKYFTYIGIEVLFAVAVFAASLAVSKLKRT